MIQVSEDEYDSLRMASGGWVRTDDRLPVVGVRVLVATKHGGRSVAYLTEAGTWDSDNWHGAAKPDYVVAWMAIPPLPE